MFCGKCGKQIDDWVNFCPDCGTTTQQRESNYMKLHATEAPIKESVATPPLPVKQKTNLFCRFCGSQLNDNATFCHKCGKKNAIMSIKQLSRKEWYASEKSAISKRKITTIWALFAVSCILGLLMLVVSLFRFLTVGSETYNLFDAFSIVKTSPIYNQIVPLLIVLLISEIIAKIIGFLVCYTKKVSWAVVFVMYSWFGITITKCIDVFISIAILVLTIKINREYKKHGKGG